MSKCQRKSLRPDIFDRNIVRCLNILLAQRSDMKDESKAFLSLINVVRIRRLDQAVKTETKEEPKHLSSQSWQNLTLVSDYAAANYLFQARRHDQSVSDQKSASDFRSNSDGVSLYHRNKFS